MCTMIKKAPIGQLILKTSDKWMTEVYLISFSCFSSSYVDQKKKNPKLYIYIKRYPYNVCVVI